jgi:lipopolysaccharide transport system ATP-binding protein
MATAIRPQVLLMDEWILAGDAAFWERALMRLEDMVRGAEILVLSSHNLYVVADWCTRVLWLEQGRIREDGPAEEVLEHYLGHPLRPKEEAKQPVGAAG